VLEIIGWTVLVLINTWFSVLVWYVFFHGGEEFSPLPIKNYWWAIPVFLACIIFWYYIGVISPFIILIE